MGKDKNIYYYTNQGKKNVEKNTSERIALRRYSLSFVRVQELA